LSPEGLGKKSATDAEMNALIGKEACVDRLGQQDCNCTVAGTAARCTRGRTLSTRDRKTCPTANFVVKYKKVDTDEALDGTVACELSERLYGAEVWWVLLEKE